ncbi:DUF5994 family protein [Streptacidiphilus sp. EB129]|uniref:DUF5994 family protein n=1 Tax=Streptacidiphilus sp. EB129 TaxID=3156262 RepID=UPI003512ADF3
MTTSTATTHSVGPQTRPAVRLALTPDGPRARLDGAWWPHSRDLVVQLPQLIQELAHSWGRITRASVRESAWAQLHHDVTTESHDVRVNWYDPAQDPHSISLFSYRIGQWELLVVPPGTAMWRAHQLMAAAAHPGNQQSAGSLLTHGPVSPASAAPHGHIRIRTRHAHERWSIP